MFLLVYAIAVCTLLLKPTPNKNVTCRSVLLKWAAFGSQAPAIWIGPQIDAVFKVPQRVAAELRGACRRLILMPSSVSQVAPGINPQKQSAGNNRTKWSPCARRFLPPSLRIIMGPPPPAQKGPWSWSTSLGRFLGHAPRAQGPIRLGQRARGTRGSRGVDWEDLRSIPKQDSFLCLYHVSVGGYLFLLCCQWVAVPVLGMFLVSGCRKQCCLLTCHELDRCAICLCLLVFQHRMLGPIGGELPFCRGDVLRGT